MNFNLSQEKIELGNMSNKNKPYNHKHKKTYVLYGIGMLANGWTNSVIGFFINYFMLNHIGFTAYEFSFITIITQISNSISDPIIGVLSDHTQTKIGRRRPYIFISAFLMPLFYSLLFTKINFSNKVIKFVYYSFIFIAYFFSETILDVPQLALLMDISNTEQERENFLGWSNFFMTVGFLVGPLSLELSKTYIFNDSAMSYSYVAMISSMVLMVSILTVFFNFKEKKPILTKNKKSKNLWKILKSSLSLLKIRSYFTLSFSFIGFAISISTLQFSLENFLKFVVMLEFKYTMSMMIFSCLFSSIFSIYLFKILINYFDKKNLYLFGILSIFLPCVLLSFYNAKGKLGLSILTIIAVFVGIATACRFYISACMLSDVIVEDYILNERRREGAFMSIYVTFGKLGFCIVQTIISSLLGLCGDLRKDSNGNALKIQPKIVQFTIRSVTCFIPAIFAVIALCFLYFYPLKNESVVKNNILYEEILNKNSNNEEI